MSDTNALSGYDYWGKLHYTVGRVNAGDSSAWCAAIGDMPDGWAYDNNMEAQMFTSSGVNVSEYTNLELSYYVWHSTENTYDYLFDYYSYDGINWLFGYAYTGSSSGWLFVSDFIPDTDWYYQKFVFSSDGAINDYEGAYLDDITIIGDSISRPNLTYGTPSGWAGPIVPSSVFGTHTVNTLYANQPTYIDFAIRNTQHSTAESFYTDLYIDGVWISDFYTLGLDSNEWILVQDFPVTIASPGQHTLEIQIDLVNWVDESNEADNIYVTNFNWVNPPTVPNLTYTIPAFWDGPIVPSRFVSTHTVSTLYSNQPTYIDWAITNNGTGSAGAFSTRLLIDGIQVQSVPIPSLAAGAEFKKEDYVDSLSAGNHTLRLEIDYLNQVSESNLTDNNLSLIFTWAPASIRAVGEVLYQIFPQGYSEYVKGFRLELWDADASGLGDLLASDSTVAWGEFDVGPISNVEEDGTRQDIYVRVYAQNEAAIVGENDFEFYPNEIIPFYFTSDTIQDVLSGTFGWYPSYPYTYGSVLADTAESGFFYIADIVRESYEKWLSFRPANTMGITEVSLRDINNTAYDRDFDIIKINSGPSDLGPDTFDEGIILHEYGHRLELEFDFFDSSEGGSYGWTRIRPKQQAACEGFAHFWSCLSRDDSFLVTSYNSFQDTTWGNLENAIKGQLSKSDTLCTSNTIGKWNVPSVASILWDIYDSHNDDYSDTTTWYSGSGPIDSTDTLIDYHSPDGIMDTLSLGAAPILDALFRNTTTGHKPDNIDEFWETWFQSPSLGHLRGMMDIWYEHGACCVGIRGDVNYDGSDANINDLNYLVNYLFRFGPPALCPEEADVNGDGSSSDINDLNYLVNRIFRFGPAPPPCP